MIYSIYLTANNGEDVPQQLQDWDGEERLELRLAGFAKDAVISIEPKPNQESETI